MKKLMVCLLSLGSIGSFAAGWETVTGNGTPKKETRQVSSYTGISLSGSMNVLIAYGNSNNITVDADENLLPYIETKVEDGKLVVRAKKGYNLKTKNNLMVNVSLTTLTSANISGSGNMSGNGAFSNTGETSVSISGSGNINIGFDKFEKLSVKVSGSGNVGLKGNSCNSVDAQISGSGNIDCSTIKADKVDANINGSGDIKVYASKSIDAKVNGSGNIFYKGDATNITSKASGSGKITRMK